MPDEYVLFGIVLELVSLQKEQIENHSIICNRVLSVNCRYAVVSTKLVLLFNIIAQMLNSGYEQLSKYHTIATV